MLERLEGFLVAGDDGVLAFRHGLLRDAAYHGLSFRRRRVLHRRVGESLELGAGTEVAGVAADLTHHFFEAGLWEKSLRYGLIAGSAARSVYANVDAAAVLDRAVAAGTRWRGARPEAVMRAAEALGDVRLSLGEFDRARAAFAIARSRVRGDVVERARLLRKEAVVAYRLGAYSRAQRILKVALANWRRERHLENALRARVRAEPVGDDRLLAQQARPGSTTSPRTREGGGRPGICVPAADGAVKRAGPHGRFRVYGTGR